MRLRTGIAEASREDGRSKQVASHDLLTFVDIFAERDSIFSMFDTQNITKSIRLPSCLIWQHTFILPMTQQSKTRKSDLVSSPWDVNMLLDRSAIPEIIPDEILDLLEVSNQTSPCLDRSQWILLIGHLKRVNNDKAVLSTG